MSNTDNLMDGNFDNGFEKLDPYSPGMASPPQDDNITSTDYHERTEEPLKEISQHVESGGIAPASENLLNFDDDSTKSNENQNEKTVETEPTLASPLPPSLKTSKEPLPITTTCTFAGSCSCLKNIDPRVLELIYWRDIKKTGVVFGSMMVLLLSLAMFSVLSVVAYLSLAALSVTVSFRLYKNILGAVQKSGEGHPFKQYLDVEIKIPEEKVHQAADIMVKHVTNTIKELRHLFLIGDLVDSLKFILLLWVLTYVGAWFNGMTLILLATVAIFTLPKVYETHKEKIDQFAGLAINQVKTVFKQLQEKIPLPGKKKKQ